MSDKIYKNRYIAEYVKIDLKCCKRNGFLTYIDQIKYSNFIEDPEKHIEKTDIVNFDIIYRRRYKEQQNSERYYQIIWKNCVGNLPEKDKEKAVAACLGTPRSDIFVDKSILMSHF